MTGDSAPEPRLLGPAADHRAAAEQAAAESDYDGAVRERFRAVTRGLEQSGVLEVQRARTARQTADTAGGRLPDDASGLAASAAVFDEVVYGARPATKDEYQLLTQVDRYSQAPPPPPEPVEISAETAPRRGRPELPDLLRSPKFWAIAAAAAVILLLLWFMPHSCSISTPPPPTISHDGGNTSPPEAPPPTPSGGERSIFDRLPKPVAFGGLQLLIAGVVLAIWRGRRRGALVGEPRPVDVPANELTEGRAQLYRRSRDYLHIATGLRAAALRRIRPALGLAPEASQEQTVAVIAARIGTNPTERGLSSDHVADVMSALYGPVDDAASLAVVVAQLDWIEAEVATR